MCARSIVVACLLALSACASPQKAGKWVVGAGAGVIGLAGAIGAGACSDSCDEGELAVLGGVAGVGAAVALGGFILAQGTPHEDDEATPEPLYDEDEEALFLLGADPVSTSSVTN
jgi:hypothetical protein